MRVVTYLGFTVLSIVIQFCVMDYIQEQMQLGDKQHIHDPNITQKKVFKRDSTELFYDIKNKPHALYFKTNKDKSLNSKLSETADTTTNPPVGNTDVSTVFDILYDENTTDISTTEAYYTSTEFDNATEVTLFETKNGTANLTGSTPKNKSSVDCMCNLLFQICDIHCCCDPDCSGAEHKMFDCDEQAPSTSSNNCLFNLMGERVFGSPFIGNLFCVVKTNLPEKRNPKKINQKKVHHYNWKNNNHTQLMAYRFEKKVYERSDPIWLLKNGTIYYLDLITSMKNNYCDYRKPIRFLKDESVTCTVKLNDLEMYHILNNSDGGRIISITERTLNSSILNCSTIHCTNWTILVCNSDSCTTYNKSIHNITCENNICSNVALKVEYTFYYYNSKIENATIKLYTENISIHVPFVTQVINVKFIMSNLTGRIIHFSGNPGYMINRPLIVSYAERNYTNDFFNSISDSQNWITFPGNKLGLCVLFNISNTLKFGLNKRTKCRLTNTYTQSEKNISTCKDIQEKIKQMTKLNSKVTVSPYGNPYNLADEDWINLELKSQIETLYENYKEVSGKVFCYNLITRVLFVFQYVRFGNHANQYQVVGATYDYSTRNVSFKIDDASVVITIDITFVDVSKPSALEYAGGPDLDIYLPRDFFFPFPSNNACICTLKSLLFPFVMVLANKMSVE